MHHFRSLLIRTLLASAFFGSAITVHAAITYQITIDPTLATDFYGPGESADQFVSSEFSATNDLPPMFSEMQITFTIPSASVLIDSPSVVASIGGPNPLTITTPELNDLGPVAQGDNITTNCAPVATAGCWNANLFYESAFMNPGATSDVMLIDMNNGEPGEDQEWQIVVDFAPDASAIGNATSVELNYLDFSNGQNEFTDYCEPNYSCTATGVRVVQVTPEPSTVWLTGMAGAGLVFAMRRGQRKGAD
jgi:hypothetical protein